MSHGIVGTLVAILVLLVMFVIILAIWYAWRMRQIYSRVGAFPCTVAPEGGKWVEGICVFGAREIAFYRQVSLSMKPHSAWRRGQIEVLSHRVANESAPALEAEEAGRVTEEYGKELMQVKVRLAHQLYDIYLCKDAFAAVVSWLDAEGPSEEPTFL